jgi:hypothetical protein
MKYLYFFCLCLIISGINVLAADDKQFIILDPDLLLYSKQKIIENDHEWVEAFNKLCNQANKALQNGPYSVVYKKTLPPSGDIHDYMSLGPYWWPDTSKPDGLPYIRRDGVVNPERYLYDNVALKSLDSAATTLSLAYFFSEKENYARHAANLIRTWFLDDSTHMNPNLKFGQAIKGKVEGRGVGIIDTRAFIRIVEAIGLIGSSSSWSRQDQDGMMRWFNQYTDWLLYDDYGIDEREHKNNHGTWYDVLVSSLAIFVGRNKLAEIILSDVPKNRYSVQIDSEGKQPYELDRTRSYHYSVMNLTGLFYLALIAEKRGIDLWSYPLDNNPSLRRALDFLLPYALKEKKWPYQMIRGWEGDLHTLSFLLRVAAKKYNHPAYEKMIPELPGINSNSLILSLLFPSYTF